MVRLSAEQQEQLLPWLTARTGALVSFSSASSKLPVITSKRLRSALQLARLRSLSNILIAFLR